MYGVRTLELLRAVEDVETHLVMTSSARVTLGIETSLSPDAVEAMADHVHANRDIGAAIASGSFRAAGMIVAPCSIKSLSAIANCYSTDLLARAADVTLKERRPLVLMVRETPLHAGHLRLMAQATEMGATIFPPVPAFYSNPATLEDLVTHSAGRALEHVGVVLDDLPRWSGRP